MVGKRNAGVVYKGAGRGVVVWGLGEREGSCKRLSGAQDSSIEPARTSSPSLVRFGRRTRGSRDHRKNNDGI